MDKCHARVNSCPSIGTSHPVGNALMTTLSQDAVNSCSRYGAYVVRIAAILQMNAVELKEINSDFVTDLNLAAYKSTYGDLMEISNIAFWLMTAKEKHHFFCEKNKIEFWWPIGDGSIDV